VRIVPWGLALVWLEVELELERELVELELAMVKLEAVELEFVDLNLLELTEEWKES
jgi:hypothetical protein